MAAAPTPAADEVVAAVLAAGGDAVAVTSAEPFGDVLTVLEARRAEGLHGGMAFTYRNPVRSTSPARTVAGARSLVVAARSYLLDTDDADPARYPARVARYAWVDPYEPLRAALDAGAVLLRNAGWDARVVADDNALVDRAAAVRAGLGWVGKNANVIVPGLGSWVALGSIVTDAPLAATGAPTEPASGCGPCTRCLPACPTGALVAPGVLDARRCLAWLLQATGPFPREHRVALGDRIYGCDDCQDACPPARVAVRGPHLAPRSARRTLDVLWMLDAPDDELLEAVGRWYIPRREVRYVRRNALVVLGNIGDGGDPAVESALRRWLCGPDPLLRAHAVWAACRLGRRDLAVALVGGDTDPMVRDELAAAGVG